MFASMYPGPIQQGPPPRVQAALAFVTMMNVKENGVAGFDGSRSPAGELTSQERATYNAAMQMLQQYFSGEMDFGDSAPIPSKYEDGEDPKDRVKAS